MKIRFFIHQFLDPWAGGTEVYCHALASELLQRGHDVAVVSVEHDRSRPDYGWREAVVAGLPVRFLNTPSPERTGFDSYHDDPVADLRMSELIARERPEAVHVLHLSGLSTGWLTRMPRPGPYVTLTLADHWLYCPRGQLLDSGLRSCSGPESSKCASCLGFSKMGSLRPSRWESGTARIDNRWICIRSALDRVDRFIAPSRDIGRRHVEAGLVREPLLTIQDYGFAIPARSRPKEGQRHQRIGFVGSLMYSKGVHVLLEAFAGAKPADMELHLYGRWTDYHGRAGYRESCSRWLGDPRVNDHGPVSHSNISAVIDDLDMLAVPSLWPENSPLVVHEAFLAGVPVMASDIGGLKELVRPGTNGWLVTPGDPVAWGAAVTSWAQGAMTLVSGGVPLPASVRTISEDADSLLRLYGERKHAA